jgi:dihydrofolate synthase/folylpolyglutamate synthase
MHVVGENPTIILDGAHNPAAVRALAGAIKSGFRYRRLILVIGVMEDKDIGRLLRGIVPMSDYVIYTRPVYFRAANPEILATEAAGFKKPGEVVQLLSEALDKAREMADPRDLIVVSGSLFTVGEAMACFDPEKYRLDET